MHFYWRLFIHVVNSFKYRMREYDFLTKKNENGIPGNSFEASGRALDSCFKHCDRKINRKSHYEVLLHTMNYKLKFKKLSNKLQNFLQNL